MTKLVTKKRYRFAHARKGVFEGVFLNKEATPSGDPQDGEFWTVAIDTSDGSGSEWLRRAKDAASTVTNLRPSLISHFEEVK